MGAKWQVFYDKFITQEAWRTVCDGLLITVEIAVLGLIIGTVIGTFIAMVKMVPKKSVPNKVLTAICDVYVGFFRGTPIISQLLIGYYVLLPLLGLNINNVAVAIIVFGMNSGAYISEIMRSGIQSVDGGQLEAARALGLSYWTSMLKVVIPQGVKNILPTLGNEFIALIKETSVVSMIAVVDVTQAFRRIGDSSYEYIIPYTILALVYLVLVFIISRFVKLLERRLAKVDRGN